MELTKRTIKDGQTWLTIKCGKEFLIIHLKNAEVKIAVMNGTTLNIEV